MLIIIIYSLYAIKNILSKKFKDNPENNSILNYSKKTLRGRIRKSPNNINYSELFVEEDKNKKPIKEIKKPQPEEKIKTLDEFFETIYEQNDISNYLNNMIKKEPEPIQLNTSIQQEEVFISGDLLIFEEKPKEMLTVDDLCNKKDQTKYNPESTNEINLATKSDPISEPENILNNSSTLKCRMKNSYLFSQTPITLIRNKN
jgi:hypothetical protein